MRTPSEQHRTPWRLLIADRRHLCRIGFAHLLAPRRSYDVIGGAETLAQTVAMIERSRPDIMVMEPSFEDANSEGDAITACVAASEDMWIIVRSDDDRPAGIEAAFRHGVSGYLRRNAPEHEVLQAIECVCRDGRYLHPELGARLAPHREDDDMPLTAREQEIAEMIALGYTNREIAGPLYVSVRTVESHRSHIMAKLRVRTRAELVRWALDAGIIGYRSAAVEFQREHASA